MTSYRPMQVGTFIKYIAGLESKNTQNDSDEYNLLPTAHFPSPGGWTNLKNPKDYYTL
jgi:hypothetical protein